MAERTLRRAREQEEGSMEGKRVEGRRAEDYVVALSTRDPTMSDGRGVQVQVASASQRL